MKRLLVLMSLLATSAQAAGFGVEASSSVAGLTNFHPVPRHILEVAVNGRLNRAPWGGLELWLRAYTSGISFRPLPGLGLSLTALWRTPHAHFGAFDLNLGVGVGATAGALCAGDECALILGPRLELMPTIEYVATSVVRPYLSLPISGTWAVVRGAPWLTAGFAIGIHFDFGGGTQ